MLKKLSSSFSAGIAVAIGGTVFLSADIKYVGAVMFCVALICICLKGYYLYTGRIGYLVEQHDKKAVTDLLIGLLGNAISVIVCGFVLRHALPNISSTAQQLCTGKLEQSAYSCFTRAIFCGILMYLAVSTYRDNKTMLGVVFCVPVFILAGFEHSIADMFYFSVSGIVSFEAFAYICLVILGNTIGSILVCALNVAANRQK